MAHLFSFDPQRITRLEAIEHAQTAGLDNTVAFSNGVLVAAGPVPKTPIPGLVLETSDAS